MKPRYILTANGKPITSIIDPMLESLTVTDETGDQADRLSISLDDTKGVLELPKEGGILGLQLGIGAMMVDCGTFTVDTVSGSGPPNIIRIEAHAVPMAGAAKMQSRKSRSWDGMSLGEIVRKIAGENGLEPVIAQDLDSVDPGNLDQTDESDVSFLSRLARTFSATVKVTAGRLAFIARGASRTASGSSLPGVVLSRYNGDLSRWSWTIASRGAYKSVVARYRDLDAASTPEVMAGEGEPSYRLPHTYEKEDTARSAAKAKLADLARVSGGQVQLDLPPRLDIIAETPVTVIGVRQGVDGQYVARRVSHTVNKGGGITTSIDCEKAIS